MTNTPGPEELYGTQAAGLVVVMSRYSDDMKKIDLLLSALKNAHRLGHEEAITAERERILREMPEFKPESGNPFKQRFNRGFNTALEEVRKIVEGGKG